MTPIALTKEFTLDAGGGSAHSCDQARAGEQ
jgi:hypothetical protein